MRYVDGPIRAGGKPAHSVTHESGRDLGESSRFNAGDAVAQQEIDSGLFEVGLKRTREQVETIDLVQLGFGLDEPNIGLDRVEFHASGACESAHTRCAHTSH